MKNSSLVPTNALVTLLVTLAAVPHGVAPAADQHPELKRLSATDDVWIDMARKEVVIGGTVCLEAGPIEYFACPKDTKDYESLVAVRSPARLIHAGLLAVGLEPGTPVAFDPGYVAATGPVVSVQMRWKDSHGKTQVVAAQEWVRDTRTKAAMKEHWVFAGSSFWTDPADGARHYQADGGDFICLSNFPTAMLDIPIESTQSNEALLFEAFEGRVPPVGTDVEILLSAGKDP
ncbi:MAG: YdjY domain-containing protein [Planctomycetia bacterium]